MLFAKQCVPKPATQACFLRKVYTQSTCNQPRTCGTKRAAIERGDVCKRLTLISWPRAREIGSLPSRCSISRERAKAGVLLGRTHVVGFGYTPHHTRQQRRNTSGVCASHTSNHCGNSGGSQICVLSHAALHQFVRHMHKLIQTRWYHLLMSMFNLDGGSWAWHLRAAGGHNSNRVKPLQMRQIEVWGLRPVGVGIWGGALSNSLRLKLGPRRR